MSQLLSLASGHPRIWPLGQGRCPASMLPLLFSAGTEHWHHLLGILVLCVLPTQSGKEMGSLYPAGCLAQFLRCDQNIH